MIDLFELAAGLQDFFLERQWKFCFIGGLALQRWGEPRVTHDIDCTLLTGFGREEPFVRELLGRYEPRIPDAAAFALENRVLLSPLCELKGEARIIDTLRSLQTGGGS